MRISKADIQRYCQRVYHLTDCDKLKNRDEALNFINECGMITLFSCKEIDLPSLYNATGDVDDFQNTWWGWKDDFAANKHAFYGRLLLRKSILSTWRIFRAFYALSGSGGELDEYLADYKAGRMGITAKNIYEYLLNNGPAATDVIRKAIHMSDRRMKGIFEKAMIELQVDLRIVKIGSEKRGWGVDVWEVLPRWIPEQVDAALRISNADARCEVMEQYIATVGVVAVSRLEHILDWEPKHFNDTLDKLEASGEITSGFEIGDELTPAVGSTAFLQELGLS